MKIPFIKLHGAKNDFLVTMAADVPVTDFQELAMAICDRHTGVGADGWMILDPTGSAGAGEPGFLEQNYDAVIRLFNSDGSEPELSGNGTRCAAVLLARKQPEKTDFHIRTGAGIRHLTLISRGDREYRFEMNMGEVRVIDSHAEVQGRDAVLVDAGNPQCAMPVEDFSFDWRATGAAVECDGRFPNRTNVSFFRRVDPHTIDVRFWERGAGETNSSGTGAAGAAVAAVSRGFAESPVSVLTPAGPLAVRMENREVYLTGPAEVIADGIFHYGKIDGND
jgi:diaminopimelate epimerase